MSKNISSSLRTDIERGVATLAILLEITRNDGETVRLTNHDDPIIFGEYTYTCEVPFTVSAFQAGSDLAADSGEVEIAIDGTVITKSDVDNGAYKNGRVKIMQVDWASPNDGAMTLRSGWFSRLESNKNSALKVEVFGLLKVLDFSVGRIYQPSCDADLGDKRCRVAIDLSQAYSRHNPYVPGDWVYKYDTSAFEDLGVVNGSFEDDGANVLPADPITGWTKSANSKWGVNNDSPYQDSLDPAHSIDGSYWIEGYPDPDPTGEETYLYQDIDLTTNGMSLSNLDDGRYIAAFFVAVQQTAYLLDPPRFVAEMYDATGALVEVRDTDYFSLDKADVWRERALVFPLLPTTRRIRFYLYAKRADADITNVAFDNVRGYYWDHTVVSPYSNVIHKTTRVTQVGEDKNLYYAPNGSFEAQAAVSNSSSNTVGAGGITSWTKDTGSFWLTSATGATDGTIALKAGDDSSGVQKTYTIYTTFEAEKASGVAAARIATGYLTGCFYGDITFGSDQGRASIDLTFLDASNVVISTFTLYALNNPSTGPGGGELNISKPFVCPTSTAKIRLVLTAETPTGTSVGNVSFDNLRFNFYDPERPVIADTVTGCGTDGTIFDTDVGDYTYDGKLIWKAHTDHVLFDRVDTVTDRKVFSGTTIAGIEGSFETSLIRWLSGANAGSYNLIRVWNPTGKVIKLYFPTVEPIVSGDRFMYVRSCQKRFVEDCGLRFDNAINFQGFPWLPGKLS